MTRSARDWRILTIQAVLMGYVVRCLPTLELPYPPEQDTYYYFISLLNIVQKHTLSPEYVSWYSQVGRQLHWPLLQLATAEVHAWTGIPVDALWRYTVPALGSLTFIPISLIAWNIRGSWRCAAYAGLLGGFGDLLIYFQDQYHPQALAILVFTSLVYLVLISRESNSYGIRVLLLLLGGAFLFSHHASALVMPFLLLPVLFVPYLIHTWRWIAQRPHLRFWLPPPHAQVEQQANGLIRYASIALVLMVCGITTQVYLSHDILLIALHGTSPTIAPTWGKASPLILVNILRSDKYLLLAVGLVGVGVTVRSLTAGNLLLLLILAGLMAASAVATVVFVDSAARFIAMWYPFVAVFAGVALATLARSYGRRTRIRAVIAALVAAVLLCAGIADSQSPDYFFSGTPRSGAVFYGNQLPRMERIAAVGRWIGAHTAAKATYSVDFATVVAPLLFGHRSDVHIIYNPQHSATYCNGQYWVVDRVLSQGNTMRPRITVNYDRFTRLYDNGSDIVMKRSSQQLCLQAARQVADKTGGVGVGSPKP